MLPASCLKGTKCHDASFLSDTLNVSVVDTNGDTAARFDGHRDTEMSSYFPNYEKWSLVVNGFNPCTT